MPGEANWREKQWRRRDLNTRPRAYESPALPLSYVALGMTTGASQRPSAFLRGSGARIRTWDLRVMSPTSCHCSTPQRNGDYNANHWICQAEITCPPARRGEPVLRDSGSRALQASCRSSLDEAAQAHKKDGTCRRQSAERKHLSSRPWRVGYAALADLISPHTP